MGRLILAGIAVALLLAACGGDEEAVYEVTLDVAYDEQLRVPGLGYVLHEFALDYVAAAELPAGEPVELEASGTAAWAIRCFEDQFAPNQEPFAEFTGRHPAIFEWDEGDLRAAGQLESGVDWTAGPALLLLETEGGVLVAHRLPSAIAADREIGCDPDDQYTAIALDLGDGAMTAPGRVIGDAGEMSRAEALNAAGPLRYVLDDGGSGWLVYQFAPGAVTDVLTPFTFTYAPGSEPEGGSSVTVQGTIRLAPAE